MSGHQRGFALSDVLIALLLLSLTASSLLLLQRYAVFQAVQAEQKAVALRLAVDALNSGRNAFTESKVIQGQTYQIEFETRQENLLESSVVKTENLARVFWETRGRQKSVALGSASLGGGDA